MQNHSLFLEGRIPFLEGRTLFLEVLSIFLELPTPFRKVSNALHVLLQSFL